MRILILLAVLFLSSCATPSIPTDYEGNDSGYAVIGIGATSTTRYPNFGFVFRKVGGEAKGGFTYQRNKIFGSRASEYETAEESGTVEVVSLQPGRYEIINFGVAVGHVRFSSRKDFAIPFEVRPGDIVYLGNYQANAIRTGTFFGFPVSWGAFFVVEDRAKVDLDLARKRVPGLPTQSVRNSTPDENILETPFLVPVTKAKLAREAADKTTK